MLELERGDQVVDRLGRAEDAQRVVRVELERGHDAQRLAVAEHGGNGDTVFRPEIRQGQRLADARRARRDDDGAQRSPELVLGRELGVGERTSLRRDGTTGGQHTSSDERDVGDATTSTTTPGSVKSKKRNDPWPASRSVSLATRFGAVLMRVSLLPRCAPKRAA